MSRRQGLLNAQAPRVRVRARAPCVRARACVRVLHVRARAACARARPPALILADEEVVHARHVHQDARMYLTQRSAGFGRTAQRGRQGAAFSVSCGRE
eukprot:1147996-Pleurochrysis_carterae.AAC.1